MFCTAAATGLGMARVCEHVGSTLSAAHGSATFTHMLTPDMNVIMNTTGRWSMSKKLLSSNKQHRQRTLLLLVTTTTHKQAS
jgi:hypothetical protein